MEDPPMKAVRRLRVVGDSVEVIDPGGYLSPAWHKARLAGVSASEVATIVGLSPYDSPFNLWWEKRLALLDEDDGLADDESNADQRRGRRLEPLVLEDFADAHPEFTLMTVGLLRNKERRWQLATPDSILFDTTPRGHWTVHPLASVEAKTDRNYSEWGVEGTDEVPWHYRAQALWQMDVLGVEVCYMPTWVGLDYREYLIEWDDADVRFLRQAAVDFLASVEAGDAPDIDADPATKARLKYLHPTLVDEDVVVDEAVVRQYLAAQRLEAAAKQRKALAENRLRNQLGAAARGVVVDETTKTGVRKVVGRSVYDVRASTYTRKAFTGDRLTVIKPKETS
jgi:putative phage-type endonuclease